MKASLQVLLDALPSYVILLDAQHRILLANQAAHAAVGRPADEVIGHFCPRIIHGLEGPFPGCPFEEAEKTGASVFREFYDPLSKSWLETSVHPTSFRTADGQAVFFHTARDIGDKKRNELTIQRNYDIQTILFSLSQLALESLPLQKLLERALDLLLSIEWLALESKGCIFLAENDSAELVMAAASGLGEFVRTECARVPFGRCLCGRAAKAQQLIFANHLTDEHDIRYTGISPHGHYCIPMIFAGVPLGVINTYLKDGHAYDRAEDDFLRQYANALAGLIVRKRTEEELNRSLGNLRQAADGMINAIAAIVERRDPYTAGHQKRATRIACAIAGEMGLPEAQIEGLHMAGIIHDIGKIYVPAEILSKPGRLTGPEFALVKTHAQVGYDILKDIEFPWPIAQIVFQHHEKIDGSGYPLGLKGNAILLEARILAVADVVEAISSHRPYRPAIGLDKALEEIEEKSGILYDAPVVKACLRIFRENGFSLESSG
ncbi:MAG: HD domain-containing protein [Candidatus Aminicenantes bacterium]|nr:HD domain-containing protein [Candidatus Aminicenantes bacterium]